MISDLAGDYVPRERMTVRFESTVVDDLTPFLARYGKGVGASKQFDVLAACETQLQGELGSAANVHRSQKYYLDVTNRQADKGTAVRAIAKWYGPDVSEVPPDVAAQARAHTGSNEEDGWAAAIYRFVLPNVR